MKIFVGYDTREDIAYQVCRHSIESLCPTAEVIPLKQNELRNDKLYWRGEDKLASTEFTFTRFLIPHLMNYNGWALFIDSDIVFTENVKNLFDLADDKYAVMCAQHDYTPKPGTKMDGQVQTQYPRKNWSSVVLWNCGHPSNQAVTIDSVNNPNYDGKYFHRFSWLKDEEVGQISHEWNWLVDWYQEPEDGTPKALHYTEGGPWFENYRHCSYDDVWKKYLTDMMYTNDDTGKN
jgi:lipopolysaccharide biosynthesis glycosyltransferase